MDLQSCLCYSSCSRLPQRQNAFVLDHPPLKLAVAHLARQDPYIHQAPKEDTPPAKCRYFPPLPPSTARVVGGFTVTILTAVHIANAIGTLADMLIGDMWPVLKIADSGGGNRFELDTVAEFAELFE
jgi:hypothetical protein